VKVFAVDDKLCGAGGWTSPDSLGTRGEGGKTQWHRMVSARSGFILASQKRMAVLLSGMSRQVRRSGANATVQARQEAASLPPQAM
jgi:hypothetical protein